MVAIHNHHSRFSSLRKFVLPLSAELSVRVSFTQLCLVLSGSLVHTRSLDFSDRARTFRSNPEANRLGCKMLKANHKLAGGNSCEAQNGTIDVFRHSNPLPSISKLPRRHVPLAQTFQSQLRVTYPKAQHHPEFLHAVARRATIRPHNSSEIGSTIQGNWAKEINGIRFQVTKAKSTRIHS